MPGKKLKKRNLIRHRILRLGFVNILLVAIVIAIAIALSGTLIGPKFEPGTGLPAAAFACCDSGDGPACKPVEGKNLTYNGQQYGLLKSNVTFAEGNVHLKDSGSLLNGDPIILNSSDGYRNEINPEIECGKPGEDQIYNAAPPGRLTDSQYCTSIPNDEIVYVCTKNCHQAACPPLAAGISGVSCYGDTSSVYNVYFKLSDVNTPGIPKAISECVKPAGNVADSAPTVVVPTQDSRNNLQLVTLGFIQQGSVPWLSPYCKPAVYLYPQQTSFVTVKVESSQPLTYTNPAYPADGWGVLANPSGQISYQNKFYDYLYYETKASDDSIDVPKKGYVVAGDALAELFSKILPKLGLNSKEVSQFSEYWTHALPKSNYYYVGIIPGSNLENITSLVINPKPQTEIRVTLYFKPLDQKIEVEQPTIVTPARTGFTVVEWGGIFKKDTKHNFSCVM